MCCSLFIWIVAGCIWPGLPEPGSGVDAANGAKRDDRGNAGHLLHERLIGNFLLQVTRHPAYGLPGEAGSFGADFSSHTRHQAAKSHYSLPQPAQMMGNLRHAAGWDRISPSHGPIPADFRSHDLFRNGHATGKDRGVHRARFSFMSVAHIWYSRNSEQETLPFEF